ncbi:TPA: hypothetical protein OKD94_004142 [Escherichia coli]|nr:hypothetical protein [Escherichia coli]HCQ3786630.1 hypothetical protein [Escherichia coli]
MKTKVLALVVCIAMASFGVHAADFTITSALDKSPLGKLSYSDAKIKNKKQYSDWAPVDMSSNAVNYQGRWDKTDKQHPVSAWPGTQVEITFEGTRAGIKDLTPNVMYDVFVDGKFEGVLFADSSTEKSKEMTIVDDLPKGKHTLLLSKRNFTMDSSSAAGSLLLEKNARLITQKPVNKKKIEFIGDSYTVGVGNESKGNQAWEETVKLSNVDKSFARVIADKYNADMQVTAKAGYGLMMDWQGNKKNILPNVYNKTLDNEAGKNWDASQWKPDLIVIGLGLNDYSGLGGWTKEPTEKQAAEYRDSYHAFITKLRKDNPGSNFLLVSPHVDWLKQQISRVVAEEQRKNKDVYYSQYDYVDGGYVSDGHPNVDTHKKIAEQLLKTIEQEKILSN